MSQLYIDALCGESEQSELIDAADSIAAISEVIGPEWKWLRLSAGVGGKYDRDIRFYEPLTSDEPQMSGEQVKSALLRCAGKGLRHCSVETIGFHLDHEDDEFLRIQFFCQEFRTVKVEAMRRRLRPELHILIEPRSLFESKRYVKGEAIDNDKESMSWLMNVFMAIAKGTKPRTVHMYLEREWALPINSHFSYWSSPRELIADLELLRAAFLDGLGFTDQPIPPLGKPENFMHLKSLSPYHADDEIERLAEHFSKAFVAKPVVTEEDVVRSIESKRFDVVTPFDTAEKGFAVTDLPWFLERWIYNFYLDVLGYEWWV